MTTVNCTSVRVYAMILFHIFFLLLFEMQINLSYIYMILQTFWQTVFHFHWTKLIHPIHIQLERISMKKVLYWYWQHNGQLNVIHTLHIICQTVTKITMCHVYMVYQFELIAIDSAVSSFFVVVVFLVQNKYEHK